MDSKKILAKNIVLIGFMGTGKTVVGQLLSKRLNWNFVDTDDLIEKKVQLTIPEIFRKYGEQYFRDLESIVIKEIMQNSNQVIATGGGIVLRKENMKFMKENGVVICLLASPKVIFERTRSKTPIRPLIDLTNSEEERLQKIYSLLNFRSPYYAQADYMIHTDNLTLEEIVTKIICTIKIC